MMSPEMRAMEGRERTERRRRELPEKDHSKTIPLMLFQADLATGEESEKWQRRK